MGVNASKLVYPPPFRQVRGVFGQTLICNSIRRTVLPILKLPLPLVHHIDIGLVEDGRGALHGDAASFDLEAQPRAQCLEGLELVFFGVFGTSTARRFF